MTLKQIEYFLKLCEVKNMNLCAQELQISQSALSVAIKNLEISLGGELFDRIAKSLVLNERGKFFEQKARLLLQNSNNTILAMRESQNINIKLFASQNTGNYLIAPIIKELLPLTNSLEIAIKNTTQIIEGVLSSKCDLGVVEGEFTCEGIRKIKICDDELVVVCGDKKMANREFFIDEISDFCWIMREGGSGSQEIFFAQIPQEIEFKNSVLINSTEAIKKAIKFNCFFACLPKFSLKDEVGIYEVKIKNIKFKRELNLIYNKSKIPSKGFLNFLDRLKYEILKFYSCA